MLKKTKLYWNTVKYLTWRQIFWRVYLQAKKQVNKRIAFWAEPLSLKKAERVKIRKDNRLISRIEKTPWEGVMFPFSVEEADDLARYNFTYLNRTVSFDKEINWHDEKLSLLWRYHLQYFDHALVLGNAFKVTGEQRYYGAFKNIFLSWLEQNPWGRGIGWHPYNISLRTVNLIYAFDLFKEQLNKDGPFSGTLRCSIAAQLLFLEKHMEFDVGGNHLLENIRALTAGGLFFYGQDAERWLEKGCRFWENELAKQILPDGGHYERSPSYHCRVMKNVGEGYFWLKGEKEALSQKLKETLQQMYNFLEGMLHPDGNLSLFNDAVLLKMRERDALLEAGKELIPHFELGREVSFYHFESSGYFGLKERGDEGTYLIIDCGPVCPDELPAHAHGDMLSFELSRGNKRVVVDSGVYTYEQGAWRDFARSTRAHNTVGIGNEDQCELWGSFRVGERVKPSFQEWKQENGDYYFRGKHYAYKKNFGVEHERRIMYLNRQVLLVLDHLNNGAFKEGVTVKSFLHLHPEFDVEEKGTGYVINGQDGVFFEFLPLAYERIYREKGVKEEKEEELYIQGWYMPDFGIKYSNYVLVLEGELKGDCLLGYLLNLSGVDVKAGVHKEEQSWLIKVALDGKEYRFKF